MKGSPADIFPSPEVRVVEASAGSGKTYALAKRYVQLILHLTRQRTAAPIHTVLAITFTNKAAFEMKERILKFLKQLALGVMDQEDCAQILEPIHMTAAEARLLASQAMDMILRRYNYFQVQTIDKFINSLLVSCAFQIGLTANFRIRTSARDYLALALDTLIDEASADPGVKKMFDDFLTSMLLVESRSAWLPKDVILDTLSQLFMEYNKHAVDFSARRIRPDDLLDLKRAALDEVRLFTERMPQGVHAVFGRSLRKFVDEHRQGFRFNPGLSAYFQPGKEIPLTKELRLTPWHEQQWEKLQAAFVRAADAEVRHLYDPYVEIFVHMQKKLQAVCQREDLVFLAELNAKARCVYEQGIAPEELYYRLAARFEHYLLDEFQDTSLLQWENLRVLPEDALSRGGSLFYVGDKKQAIYSFRGGETGLFDGLMARYADPGYHLFRENLSTSRRSHAAIVAFNNEVFSMSNLEAFLSVRDRKGKLIVPARPEDHKELERIYHGARQQAVHLDPEGCVRVELLQGEDKASVYADARPKVLARLKEIRERFSWRDIGILVRKNDEVEEVTRWLFEEGIPSSSERTLNIKEHVLVGEIIAFLRFLASPVDNLAFGTFIQGRIFMAASGMAPDKVQDAVLLWRQAKEDHLYVAFRRMFPLAWEAVIEDFFKHAGLYPLYETLSSFYRRTGVLDKFPDDQGFLMHLLELVRANEDEFADMDAFLRRYDDLEGDELYVEVVSADAVQVMTVHKAKGLEFRAVIVPFLSMSLQRGRSGRNKALHYTLRSAEDGLVLYHFNEQHTRYSALAWELDVDEKMALFFSELNNIYVALTRAACEMYVFIPPRAGNGANLALHLIPADLLSRGVPAVSYPRKKPDKAGAPCELLPPVCRDWMFFLEDEFSPGNDSLQAAGERCHALLAGERGDLDPLLKAQVEAFLADERVKCFFPGEGARILVEQDFVDRTGRSRRMDRVLVFDQEVWVVDFKLSGAGRKDGYPQVREYMKILADVFPAKNIRGFLAFIQQKDVLEVYG